MLGADSITLESQGSAIQPEFIHDGMANRDGLVCREPALCGLEKGHLWIQVGHCKAVHFLSLLVRCFSLIQVFSPLGYCAVLRDRLL